MAFRQAMAGNVVDCSYVVNDDVYTAKVPQNLREMGMVEGKYYGIILPIRRRGKEPICFTLRRSKSSTPTHSLPFRSPPFT